MLEFIIMYWREIVVGLFVVFIIMLVYFNRIDKRRK